MDQHAMFGTDLDLGFVADEDGTVVAGPFSPIDLQARRRGDLAPRVNDLGVVSGRPNIVQSLILRLKTERGELAPLGHPNYGSQHHRLIGEPNTETNRSLIRLYVLECLRDEPRIERVLRLDVRPEEGRENRDKVKISLSVQLTGLPNPLSLVVPFSFDSALA